ncbi:aminotransferase class V-fold PLP-dependent enzyme [Aeropyrum camini]|uniref:Aminotransferase n=1 Tax=Aeropyrum camini SY1 = JCM 12091 TaxID=1198449 RepID=U3TDQ4_9CREN|nr:aminotransferase class V-fold PLP-dependent enzyme [Aeropyrum camini]BAN90571.1 aminotransferase [Aeropyrum camini SY1 = JCM 12091]
MSSSWLTEVRSRIPIFSRKIYLDTAGAGPLTLDVKEAVEGFLDLWNREGEPWGEALEDIVEARRLFASMVGAKLEEVAAVPGVSYGLNAFLSSLKLPRESNVVVSETNFPTGVYTFHAMARRGLIREVRIARATDGCVGLDGFERLVDDNTSIVYVDMVSWITGCRENLRALAELAHSHGALMVSDVFHAAGVHPLDVKKLGLDAAFTGSYKWLLGLHGGGFAYVSQELLPSLDPMFSGWMAIDDSVMERLARGEPLFSRPFDLSEFRRARDAKVLEWGTWPAIAFVSLKASLKLLTVYDAPGLYNSHTGRLVQRLIDSLASMGVETVTPRGMTAGIVVFRHREPERLGRFLESRGIVASVRPGSIRVSIHFYNSSEDLDALLEALEEFGG